MIPLPEALIKSLKQVKGFDEASFRQIHASEEQVISVRYNPAKLFNKNCLSFQEASGVAWCPLATYLPERPSFIQDPLWHAGCYYVQEASSMFLWQVLQQAIGKNTPGLKVLDICAAPGGKSTLLASYFKDGLLIANELIKSRTAVLTENMTRWGSNNVVVTSNDSADFKKIESYFDVIVTDAPCSGSGLFRKDPEAINQWSEHNVMLCSQRQQQIIENAYPSLKKNGLLIYSTCSYSEEENENILDWMMEKFNLTSIKLNIEESWNITETLSAKAAYGYRFYPDKVLGEGFFIAAFCKNEGEYIKHKYPPLLPASKQEQYIADDWLKNDRSLSYFKQNEKILALAREWKDDIAFLKKNLYIRKAGTTAGLIKGKSFIPDHELALSMLINKKVSQVSLDKADAVLFLKRKEFNLKNVSKGWYLVDFCEQHLGWIKVLDNRINNYFPVEWRILKD